MKHPNFFTQEEANKVLRKIREIGNRHGQLGDRNEVLFKLIYRTGMRISEAINLDVSNVSFTGEYGTISVYRKGGYWGTLSLDERMGEDLERYIDNHKIKKGKLFNITRQRAWQILREALDELGLDDDRPKNHRRSPHTWRHSNAIMLLMSGMSTREVQERLGHSNIATTEQYLKYLPEEHLAEKNIEIWREIDEK